MINEITHDCEQRMQKSIAALKSEFTKLRTGRAHPGLLEHISVEYYGSQTPLNQVANVAIEDARTLTVTPWEKDMVTKIEKSIRSSDLGLNPVTAGMVIRIPLPPLTEERRRDLTRIVRSEAEKARVAIRNLRREANNDFKELVKEKEISEDEEHRATEGMQKLTDRYTGEIDEISGEKEKDLMAV